MGALIAGIISAVVGGVAGMAGSLVDDKKARERVGEQQDQVREDYLDQLNYIEETFAQAKEQAEHNAAKAEKEADLTDKNLTNAEEGLTNDVNAAIDELYLGQTADAYSWNQAAMQAGSSEGASYAALGASGVRAGSSMSDAVQMEAAVNANQLQFAQDSKRQSDSNGLAGVLNNLAGNRFNIQANRIGADFQREEAAYLRNSYLEGGHNYNLYDLQKRQLERDKDYKLLQLQHEYDEHSGSNAFWNAFIKLNTGGAQGFTTGYNIGDTISKGSKYKDPDYKVTIGGKD